MTVEERSLREETRSSRLIYDGTVLHVYEDEVALPNGKPAGREIIRHVGAVCVLPLLEDGTVVVERQFRYPMNEVITEIPAGKLESRQEDPLDAARRELREETGYLAGEMIFLGMFYPAAAYSDERIWMYLARKLRRGEQELDEDEFLNVKTVPLEKLAEQVMAGEIPDAKTQTAVLKTLRFLREAKTE